ncbi:hypothetical protein SK128_013403 [Halocaridina rubra]|uniref:Uncharacterized protein n=1 Tax=Halocaridina rubra TaxID=373956 RepID=A0AAN8WVW3_HALRR
MRFLKIVIWLTAAFLNTLQTTAVRFQHQQEQDAITGVLQPGTGDLGRYNSIVSATIDILPEVSRALDQISNSPGRSRPSDAEYIEKVLSLFIPLSKKIYIADAETKGLPIERNQISRLNAAEYIMPAIFQFMKQMRSSQFFGKESREMQEAGNHSSGLGIYANMVEATNSLLPILTNVFRDVTSSPDHPNPEDPDFLEEMMLAFLPASREILQVAAKAEGRVLSKEELDQLDIAIPHMPNIFKFLQRARKVHFYGSS